jgi:AcrR family transcriptional regulator
MKKQFRLRRNPPEGKVADEGSAEQPIRPGSRGPGPSERPPRRPLDQALIVREAVDFIDEHGRELLTMRRLGARLGVEAMALYRYLPGREALLDCVVESLMDELYDVTMTGEYGSSWQEYLQQLAHSVRGLALAHPRIFPLVASRPPAAPWLRPPLRSLRWVEEFLTGLAQHGFNDVDSVLAYRTFSTFLLGHLLLESSAMSGESISPEDDELPTPDDQELWEYPRLLQLEGPLTQNAFAEEFDDALEDLINRITIVRSRPSG